MARKTSREMAEGAKAQPMFQAQHQVMPKRKILLEGGVVRKEKEGRRGEWEGRRAFYGRTALSGVKRTSASIFR